MGKAFNQGLDRKAENYKEEGVIKLLKDIRDKMVRPIGRNNDNSYSGGNNDDNDDNDDEYLLKLDIDDKNNEELKAEELDRRLKKLINKKRFELFR